MSLSETPTNVQSQPQPQPKEPRRMTFLMNRFLDVAASVLIVVLASFTAGATAILGA